MTRKTRAISPATAAVLVALANDITYGFDIMDATGLPSGTVYPILARLEQRGLAESDWEDPQEHRAEGRPARRYYRITTAGLSALADERERILAMGLPVPGLA